MTPGTADLLIGAAFAVLLALAITTVVLGVITALKVHDAPTAAATEDDRPSARDRIPH
ncbi:hypothetical protein [Kitasatospora sp. NBC_00458]|uniref:hypothetical protein n=1 Tax=Kitasatospora sp. NBC_00458 TaxID=2903568 RepID=UPI002E199B14